MRLKLILLMCLCALASEATLRWEKSSWCADVGFSFPRLEGAVGWPLDLPRAEAYLVTENGRMRLEDRFDAWDLWVGHAVRGHWVDASGNEFYLMRLDARAPDARTVRLTRREEARQRMARTFTPKQIDLRDEAARALSPVELGACVRPRRTQRPHLAELISYHTTNDHVCAVAFRPKSSHPRVTFPWYLAVLIAEPSARAGDVRASFDEDFLDQIVVPSVHAQRALPKAPAPCSLEASEEDFLCASLRENVCNYPEWTCSRAPGVLVIDNLDPLSHTTFLSAFTNQYAQMRGAFAESVPSPLAQTNALAVVRLFRSRQEYLAYVGEEAQWTAALWSPTHRELVGYLPEGGVSTLLATIWHETFHQYLAYAGAMLMTPPWFNEGHAQLFEHLTFSRTGEKVFGENAQARAYVKEYASQLAEILPTIFELSYTHFYAGTQEEVQARYFLAWSLAYFLEVGAPQIRFQPYADLRTNYLKELVRTRSMEEATKVLFATEKARTQFIAHWLQFWKSL